MFVCFCFCICNIFHYTTVWNSLWDYWNKREKNENKRSVHRINHIPKQSIIFWTNIQSKKRCSQNKKTRKKKEYFKKCLLESHFLWSSSYLVGWLLLKGCNYVRKHLHTNFHCPHCLRTNPEQNWAFAFPPTFMFHFFCS